MPHHVVTLATLAFVFLALPSANGQSATSAKHPVPENPLWLTYSGEDGPGKGKHIVLIAADQEYRSEYALPMLAKILAKHHGFDCTVLFSVNDKNEVDPTMKIRWEDKTVTHNIPGLEYLNKANLVILFSRLISLPDSQLQHVYTYLDSGKPIIGIRTANHGFLGFDYKKDGKRIDFGDHVLGGSFRNHHGRWQQDSTRGIIVEENKNHPVLNGVKDIWGLTDVYRITNGPTTRGFDHYFGTDVPNYPPFCYIENDRTVGIPSVKSSPEFNVPGPMLPDWQWVDILPELSRRSVKYIEDAAKHSLRTPFFLYVPLTSPHFPVVPSKEFQGKSKAGDYGDFVVQTDAVVGEILRALDENGLAENTIVIFTSDNGPEVASEIGIGAYERLRRFGHASMGLWRGVKRDLWEGGHRVPFLVRWPGQVRPNSTSNETIGFTDLMTTFAAIVKTPLPNDAAEDSVDISAAFRGEKVKREGLVHASVSGKLAIRQGDWVLIAAASGQDNNKAIGEPAWFRMDRGYVDHKHPFELYNLREDPTQNTNLYAEQIDRAKAMHAVLERFQSEGRSVPRRAMDKK